MKIYFSGSIRGGREDADIYRQIIHYLQNFGHVLTEHIGDSSLDSSGESKIDDQKIHDRDIELLLESDIIIAEVTNPSLGVGYEIAKAIDYKKKVVCLYRKKGNERISAMILGSPDIISLEYQDIESLKKMLPSYF